jgi:hypothetical protein
MRREYSRRIFFREKHETYSFGRIFLRFDDIGRERTNHYETCEIPAFARILDAKVGTTKN